MHDKTRRMPPQNNTPADPARQAVGVSPAQLYILSVEFVRIPRRPGKLRFTSQQANRTMGTGADVHCAVSLRVEGAIECLH